MVAWLQRSLKNAGECWLSPSPWGSLTRYTSVLLL